MKIVLKDRRFGDYCYEGFKVILELDAKTLAKDIPLTKKAVAHWKVTDHGACGYVSFRTLSKSDIISIVSASKRHEALLGIDRWGRPNSYKLLVK